MAPIRHIYWTIKIKSRWSFTERYSRLANLYCCKMKIRCHWIIEKELSAKVLLLIVCIPGATREFSQNHHLLVWGTVWINNTLCVPRSFDFTPHVIYQSRWVHAFATCESNINSGWNGMQWESEVVGQISSVCSVR